ncbi:MAG: hypothetical protein Q9169_007988 [Polycauliona sp. 2 TL-2023]
MSSLPTGSDPIPEIGYTARSDSPTSPSFSPITPVMSNELPPPDSQHQHTSQAAEPAPLLPVTESDNPDAIALRAAISILLIQRQQAHRDMILLKKQKQQALADPIAYNEGIKTGTIKVRSTGPLSLQSFQPQPYDAQDEDGEQARSDTETREKSQPAEFGDTPSQQDIVRCPPINWAKYHVLGEPLDKLHEEQRRRPLDGERVGETQTRGEEYVIAAPYNPLKDVLPPKPKPAAGGSGSHG